MSIGDSSSQTIAVAGGTTIVTTGKNGEIRCREGGSGRKSGWNTIVVPRGGEYELVLADGNAGVVEFGVSPDLSRSVLRGSCGR